MPKKNKQSKSSKSNQLSKKVIKKPRLKKKNTNKFTFFVTLQSNYKTFISTFDRLSLRTKALFVFGLLFLLISTFWRLNQSIQLAFFTPHVVPVKKIYAIPTQLIIPKVDVDLTIEETAINNGAWQVSERGASHLTISARPGEKGPIIMYGHNTDDRLGPIRWLSQGDTITLQTADKKSHIYKISQTMSVSPKKIDIFTARKGETLILYTCDGFADLQRFVIIALPK